MKPLRIALTKGRLEKDTIGLLEQAGYDCTAVREKGRRLILPIGSGEIEVVLAKAADVITSANAVLHWQEKQGATFTQAITKRPLPQNIRMLRGAFLKAREWISVLSRLKVQ